MKRAEAVAHSNGYSAADGGSHSSHTTTLKYSSSKPKAINIKSNHSYHPKPKDKDKDNNNNMNDIESVDENELLSISSLSLTPSPTPQSVDAELNNTYFRDIYKHHHHHHHHHHNYNYKYFNNHQQQNGYNIYSNNNNLIPLSLIYGFIRLCLKRKPSSKQKQQKQRKKRKKYNDDFDDDEFDEYIFDHFDDDHNHYIDTRNIAFILSSNITQLILLYFDDNKFDETKGGKQYGSFLWKLPTLELLTAKCIDSIPFQIGSFLWYLSIYPYGIDDEHINFTNLYINLSSTDNILFRSPICFRELIINARLYCIETKSCWSSIKVFKSDSDYHGWQKGALKIHEICKYKSITFILYINILKIRKSHNLLLYQYPLQLNINNNRKNKFIIKWKIDKLLMNDLKRANEMKRFESDICYNMWVLGCVPNGIKKDNESSVFKIYLKLCALPPNISKIKVKFNILCVETKKHLKYIYNDFDYKHKYWQTDKLCKRSYLIFNDFNTLRFKAEIEIIEQYDLNYNELSSNIWKTNIKNKTVNNLITKYIYNNKHKLILLINGYIRQCIQKYNEYNDYNNNNIIEIINKFYPKINGDLFTWNISCEQIIKLSQINYKQRFDSKIFYISSLKWFLQIYPNGYRPEDEGFCSVYLILAYLPSILSEITIHFGVYCPQTMSNFSTIHTFNHSRDGRGTRRMLSLSHLKKIFNFKNKNGSSSSSSSSNTNKFITFNCYINILRIKIKEKQIIYQYPLILNKSNYANYIYCNFEWRINKNMMIKFKQCNNGQRFESAIFNEMWNLSCFPNENKNKSKDKDKDKDKDNKDGEETDNKTEGEEEQNVVIGIRLCSLPKNIERIRVKYKLLCVEFESDELNIKYEWQHIAYFDYDNYYVKNPKHTIKSQYINKYDELTFIAQINIVELYDLNGKIINKYNQQ